MIRATIFLAALLLASVAAFAQTPVAVFSGKLAPLGHKETASFSTATGLPSVPNTKPNIASFAYIYCNAAITWRDDGTNPTSATIGTIPATTWFWYAGNLNTFKMIPVSGSAQCGANYYR